MENIPRTISILLYLISLLGCSSAISTVPFHNPEVSIYCPDGWYQDFTHCYQLYTQPQEWQDAQNMCQLYGANLIAGPGKELEMIGQYVENSGTGVTEWWTGMTTKNATEGTLQAFWSDGKATSLAVMRWGQFSPDTYSDKKCVKQIISTDPNYVWYPYPGRQEYCEEKFPFVCELKGCVAGSKRCANGECIKEDYFCDGTIDCKDASDEFNCTGITNSTFPCSEIQQGESGSIDASTGDSNQCCFWSLYGVPDKYISIQFSSLTVSPGDSVDVYIGSPVGGESLISFADTPVLSDIPPLYSSNNFMVVRVCNNDDSTTAQMTATWKTVDELPNIGFELTAITTEQQFTSLSYPELSPAGRRDVWLITSSPIGPVQIWPNDVNLGAGSYIEIRDGETAGDDVLYRFDEDFEIPESGMVIVSTAPVIRVYYHSEETFFGAYGFNFTYLAGCDIVYNADTGIVVSPGYPELEYGKSTTCTYSLTSTDGSELGIEFLDFTLEASDDLEIFDGRDDTAASLVSLTGSTIPASVVSTTDSLFLRFSTNPTIHAKGFNFMFGKKCPDPGFDNVTTSVAAFGGGPPSFVFPRKIEVTCNDGYFLGQESYENETSAIIKCGPKGWKFSMWPVCEPVCCGPPPEVDHGFINSSTGATFMNTVMFDCVEGYLLDEDDTNGTIVCQSNGTWSMTPTCIPAPCSPLNETENGNYTVASGDGQSYGSVVQYTCNEGYEVSTVPIILCQANSEWNNPVPICQPRQCYVKEVVNGNLSAEVIFVGDNVNVTCNPGYALNGSAALTCGTNQRLGPMPTCDNINECVETPDVCDNTTSTCEDLDGDYICNCLTGYEPDGTIPNVCIDIDECATDDPCNGTCNNTIGSYTCGCLEGYTLYTENGTNAFLIPDPESGTGESDVYRVNHTCVKNECPDPTAAVFNGVALVSKDNYYFGDELVLFCDMGFMVNGTGSITCLPDGSWNDTLGECVPAECQPLDTSTLTTPPTLSPNTTIDYNLQVTYTCTDGRPSPLSYTRTCVYDVDSQTYKYDLDTDSNCPLWDCGPYPNVSNAAVTADSGGTTFDGTATIACNTGYSQEGSTGHATDNSTTWCGDENGTPAWKLGNFKCVRTGFCPDPGMIAFSDRILSADPFGIGSTIYYNCSYDGYTFGGDGSTTEVTLTCGANGAWDVATPSPCNDSTAPVITNCSSTQVFTSIEPYTKMGDVFWPEVTDNSGYVYELFHDLPSSLPLTKDTILTNSYNGTYTFTAKDGAGLTSTCVVEVGVLDHIPPTIQCVVEPLNTTSIGSSVDMATELAALITTDGTLVYDPPTHTFSSAGEVINITVYAQTGSLRSPLCIYGMTAVAELCSEGSLGSPLNASITGSTATFTVTCDTGTYLTHDVSYLTTLTNLMSYTDCDTGTGAFTPALQRAPSCAATSLAIKRVTFTIGFDAAGTATGCEQEYIDYVTAQGSTIADQLTEKEKDGIDASTLTPSTYTFNAVDVAILSTTEVAVDLTLDFEVPTGENARFAQMEASVIRFLTKGATNINLMNSTGGIEAATCPTLTSNGAQSTDTVAVGEFVCKLPDAFLLLATDNNQCLPCAAGSFHDNSTGTPQCTLCSVGEYQPDIGQPSCLTCPGGSTKTNGSTSLTDCISSTPCNDQGLYDDGSSSAGDPACVVCIGSTADETTCNLCKATEAGHQCVPDATSDIQYLAISSSGDTSWVDCPDNFMPVNVTSPAASLYCEECQLTEKRESGDTACTVAPAPTNCNSSDTGKAQAHSVDVCTVCPDGYWGVTCKEAVVQCPTEADICAFGGTCTTGTCSCVDGTTGDNCEVNADDCSGDPCQNGGICEDGINSYTCHCDVGFTDENCTTTSDPCDTFPCYNDGNCSSVDSTIFCECPDGYSGPQCEEDIDECASNPCLFGGNCTDGTNMYTCECPDGTSGSECEALTLCGNDTCDGTGLCVEDYIDSMAICMCSEGYERDPAYDIPGSWPYPIVPVSFGNCIPEDFCDPDPCLNSGNCTNVWDGYTCECMDGYTGSICQYDIDDCANDPCQNEGTCTDEVANFQCNCTTGWEGIVCDVDVDECSSLDACNNQGSCTNTNGTYSCDCYDGYTGVDCETEIDECAYFPCMHNSTCDDAVNNYTCSCQTGWEGGVCNEFTDTCAVTNCSNGALCRSLFDDYFCECQGTSFGPDCSLQPTVCDKFDLCLARGNCSEDNSTLSCSCDEDYKGKCCAVIRNPCLDPDYCLNDGTCKVLPNNTAICECEKDYIGERCEVSKDDCIGVTCDNGGSCLDGFANYFCQCPVAIAGKTCDIVTDPDFNVYFYWREGYNYGRVNKFIKLGTTALTVGLWVHLEDTDNEGTIFTLIGFPSINDPTEDSRVLMTMDTKKITLYFDPDSPAQEINFSETFPINDVQYYYQITAEWDNTGAYKVYINTVLVDFGDKYAIGITLPEWADLFFGSAYDIDTNGVDKTRPPFFGDISMFYMWSEVLVPNDILVFDDGPLVAPTIRNDSLIYAWIEPDLKGGAVVIRKNRICTSFSTFPSCPPVPKVRTPPFIGCPQDPFLYPTDERETVVTFDVTIADSESIYPPISAYVSGYEYLWGWYRNAWVVFDSENRASMCTFDMFVQSERGTGEVCKDPVQPANGTHVCQKFEDYQSKTCKPECNTNYAFSVPTPNFYTCGPHGSFNTKNFFLDFKYTDCAPATPARAIISIRVEYNSIDNCQLLDESNNAFVKTILKNLNIINDKLSKKLCGVSCCADYPTCDVPVSNVRITVTCPAAVGRRRLLDNHPLIDVVIDNIEPGLEDDIEAALNDLLNLDPDIINGDDFSLGNFTATLTCEEPQKVLLNGFCVTCSAGTSYNDAEKRCDLCPVGTYQDQFNQTSCISCPEGNTTETVGSDEFGLCQANCSIGFYNKDKSTTLCTACELGFWQNETGQFFCEPCQVGWTTYDTNSTTVKDCFEICKINGTEYRKENETCLNCTKGTYRMVDVETMCTPCPPDKTTVGEGSVTVDECNITLCTPGQFYNESTNLCYPCPIGTYLDMMAHNELNCSMCPENHTTLVEGTVKFEECLFYCEPGYQEDPEVNKTCIPCEIGYFKDNSDPGAVCFDCSPYTSLGEASVERLEQSPYNESYTGVCNLWFCEKGNEPNDVNDECDLCPLGKYQPEDGQVECLDCANGTSTREKGAVNQTQCEPYCPDGQEDVPIGTCTDCAIGYYKNNSDGVFLNCTLCPIEFITASEGSVSAKDCNVGNCTSGQYTTPNKTCEPCAVGEYQPEWWKTECIPCGQDAKARDLITPDIGSKFYNQCLVDCPSGTEYDATIDECVVCEIGFYREQGKGAFCEMCDPRYITPGNASTSVADCTIRNCSAGEYRDEVLNECFDCPQGSYSEEKWQTECDECADNYTTWTPGSSEESDCILEDSCVAERDNCTKPENGGQCTFNNTVPGWFVCSCRPGFNGAKGPGGKPDFSVCIHLCDLGYCMNGGTCNDTVLAEPTCLCPEYYSGPRCQIRKVPPSRLPLILGLAIGGFLLLLSVILLTVCCCWKWCRTPYIAPDRALLSQPGFNIGPTRSYVDGPVVDYLSDMHPGLTQNTLYQANDPSTSIARSQTGYSQYEPPSYVLYEDKEDGAKIGPGLFNRNIFKPSNGQYSNFGGRIGGSNI